jgi:hypothetical protein
MIEGLDLVGLVVDSQLQLNSIPFYIKLQTVKLLRLYYIYIILAPMRCCKEGKADFARRSFTPNSS